MLSKNKLTPEEIEVRIWGFVVVMITIILSPLPFLPPLLQLGHHLVLCQPG